MVATNVAALPGSRCSGMHTHDVATVSRDTRIHLSVGTPELWMLIACFAIVLAAIGGWLWEAPRRRCRNSSPRVRDGAQIARSGVVWG